MSHTPGPWVAFQNSWDTVTVLAGSIDVATLNDPAEAEDDPPRATLLPDGKLVAAAPDLLAACKDALDALGRFGANSAALACQRAIEKAEGGP